LELVLVVQQAALVVVKAVQARLLLVDRPEALTVQLGLRITHWAE
jgi:hypothetical protein